MARGISNSFKHVSGFFSRRLKPALEFAGQLTKAGLEIGAKGGSEKARKALDTYTKAADTMKKVRDSFATK